MFSKFLCFFISLPKTLYFNFSALPFSIAVRLPFYINYNVKIETVRRGIIQFNCPIKSFLIKFGAGGSKGIISNHYGSICLENGTLLINGKSNFAEGSSLRINGNLSIGKNFSTNKNCFISCAEQITIGDDVLVGWNVAIRDSDGHPFFCNGERAVDRLSILIGDHVWIASESHILKGVRIASGSIVGYKSLVTRKFIEPNILIAGHPASKMKDNVSWRLKF